ncbi:MAG: hypothetical protein ACYC7L_11180 [Nitrospirota bacterium]
MPFIPIRTIALLAAVASLFFCAARPAGAAGNDPFAEGSMRVSVLLGNGYAFDENYFIAGAGFGYYLAKGLEAGLDGEFWTGGTRGITKISPGLKYVLPTDSTLRPYIGAFYRRTIIENYDDLNSVGGRAGAYFVSGRGSYFGAGAVYEKYLSCTETAAFSCSDAYMEIILAFAF